MAKSCLIVVDVQNDFCPGGALAVPEGDRVVMVVNPLLDCFGLVVATQDWHPREHESFAIHHPGKQPGDLIDLHGLPQILWPVHCVQGTLGAEFHKNLKKEKFNHIIQKGSSPTIDSYSGFFDNGGQQGTGLLDYLRREGVTEVHVAGLATDYCVKFTALDAARLGFKTFVVRDGCRAVNLSPGDGDKAFDEMARAGIILTSSPQYLKKS